MSPAIISLLHVDTRAAAERVAPGQGSLSGHEGAGSLGGLAWMKALVLNDGSGCDFVSECSLWLSAFSQGSRVMRRSERLQSVCFGDCVCVAQGSISKTARATLPYPFLTSESKQTVCFDSMF